MLRYCIVGTGFSGTCMIWHFVHAIHQILNSNENLCVGEIEISTIERRTSNGPGMPYDLNEVPSFHLCNNPAEKMYLLEKDFMEWMRNSRDEIIKNYPKLILEVHPTIEIDQWQPKEDVFYPRALFGIYLSTRFEEACTLAESIGITVRKYNGYEAIDGETRDGKFYLKIKNIESNIDKVLGELDRILLASGHWQDEGKRAKNVLSSPYPAKNIHRTILALQKKKDRLTIYIHGMGPSAVDAILTICQFGNFKIGASGLATHFKPCWDQFKAIEVKIIAGSRSGFFPGVRWPVIDYHFNHLTAENIRIIKSNSRGFIRLSELMSLVNLELQEASDNELSLDDVLYPKFTNAYEKLLIDAQGNTLQTILYTIVLRARRLKFYQNLSPEDKNRYDESLDSHFIRMAVPIPLPNARKLICLMEAGILSTVQLGYLNPMNAVLEISNGKDSDKSDMIIFANGKNYNINKHSLSLIKNLIRRREIIEHRENGYRTGGISASPTNCFQVQNNISGHLAYSHNLYSFGPITQYWQNQNNYAGAFVEAAQCIAQDWASYVFPHIRKI